MFSLVLVIYNPLEVFSMTDMKSAVEPIIRVPRGAITLHYEFHKNIAHFNFTVNTDESVLPDKVVLYQGYWVQFISLLEVNMIV